MTSGWDYRTWGPTPPTPLPQTTPKHISGKSQAFCQVVPKKPRRPKSQDFLLEPLSEGNVPEHLGNTPPIPEYQLSSRTCRLLGEGERSWGVADDSTPQLFNHSLLDVFNMLTPLLGLLFEAPALLEGGDPVLHLLLLVLTHLAPELIGML